ncbi:MAG: dihydroneopterin aldolase [Cyanobium sp. NAT70]|nr:dihydroneopterin aldolase [Cyanobium sp. NAT70]|tara:strand:+ start:226 stop:588 length:363 start_codon:yes stop_codon:yes gene_type:complete
MDAIHVRDLRLWAHVGVLENERRDGQWFSIDLSLWLDLTRCAAEDDLSATADYSVAIRALQVLAMEIRCLTIEHFSEQVLDRLEALYGQIPMRVLLSKCSAPVPGFSGLVSVERRRHGAP